MIVQESEGGFCFLHDIALTLVCGPDFLCKLMSRAVPGDLRGSRRSNLAHKLASSCVLFASGKRPKGHGQCYEAFHDMAMTRLWPGHGPSMARPWLAHDPAMAGNLYVSTNRPWPGHGPAMARPWQEPWPGHGPAIARPWPGHGLPGILRIGCFGCLGGPGGRGRNL